VALNENDRRMNRLRRYLGCRTDSELAAKIDAKQPQISRWRTTGFPRSTGELVDKLIKIISKSKREITQLKKEIKALKQAPDENDNER
jgi:hypothetical protein